MAWYWWVLIIVAVLGLIGAAGHSGDSYEEDDSEDWANRLEALIIIDDLKYKHPEVWARCASKIMGREIDTPTPEQVARWNEQLKQRKQQKP